MKDLIILKSMDSREYYLKKLKKPDNTESKIYVLKLGSPLIKYGEKEGKRIIELYGGPVVMEGSYLKDAEATVKFIDFNIGYGYIIEFE